MSKPATLIIMEDDSSNSNQGQSTDIGNENDDRPIMLLLKRLIKNKQNTIMTNTQILEILQKEFDFDVDATHELEVDIYIKIIKKFLKDWPQWEELERVSSRLNNLKDYQAVSNVLKHKYKNLKEYLGMMLKAAQPLAKTAVEGVIKEKKVLQALTADSTGEPVLEVNCTREELNNLFIRYAKSDSQSSTSIFNIANILPKRISCNMFSLESILELWSFRISIVLNTICFIRDLTYNYKHTLINKARPQNNNPNSALEEGWLMQVKQKQKQVSRKEIIKELRDIMLAKHNYDVELVTSIIKVLKEDLEKAPEYLKLSTTYKKNCNKYKYVRYLYTEQENAVCDKHDLQLEETISPKLIFCITKYSKSDPLNVNVDNWLRIECLVCKMKFTERMNEYSSKTNLKERLVSHFNDRHQHNEPDWTCTNCNTVLSMAALADSKWWHEC